ncbi:MAG: biotin--[acetyl-CoA-carboxylase] ligase [Clostridia bacterium]|nr:biotin--[acetyl-CoA-carboxylase] ligase [Clostridia bacterium]
MDAKYIQDKLNTKFIGNRLDYYETIDSTHLLAKKLSINEIENGMIIFADNQTSGIGTHERKWFTGDGQNLSFDMIFNTQFDIKKIENLTLTLAECIVKTLKELYNIEAYIKKPNDVILNGKKIAGILTETVAVGNIIKKLFIGIGININQTYFPGSLENLATSLKNEFGKEFDRLEVFSKFLELFEKEYFNIINIKEEN